MPSGKRSREEACPICHHWHDTRTPWGPKPSILLCTSLLRALHSIRLLQDCKQYEGGEQCAICGHVKAPAQVPAPSQDTAQPTDVIAHFLYLGSYDHATRSELLKAMGITHILNVVPTCQNLYKNSFTYHTASSSPADMQECFAFIDQVMLANGRVLVHCMTGVSKSASIVVGYLMHRRKWRLRESYQWVKDRRPTMRLSQVEQDRLQQLEVVLLGQSSTGFQPSQGAADGSEQGPFSWTSWSNTAAAPDQQAWQQPAQAAVPAFSFAAQQADTGRPFVFGHSNGACGEPYHSGPL